MTIFVEVKNHLALILSFLIFVASLRDGSAAIASNLLATQGCCTVSIVDDSQENLCDATATADDFDLEEEECCTGDNCDCTCCIHLPLYNFGAFDLFQDAYQLDELLPYKDDYSRVLSISIFHPPLA